MWGHEEEPCRTKAGKAEAVWDAFSGAEDEQGRRISGDDLL